MNRVAVDIHNRDEGAVALLFLRNFGICNVTAKICIECSRAPGPTPGDGYRNLRRLSPVYLIIERERV